MFSIPKENLTKGQIWFYNISVFDGQVWSANQTSFSITIINSLPIASDIFFIDTENQNFIIEDENLSITYTFLDADGNDSDISFVQWYVNGVHQPQYDDSTTIPFSETVVGQIWSVQIIPNDGEDNGTP
ncbi:MAG: hypothetical protein ACW99Q_29535, partial [Candidatus Kariarchaeaceae archaeon]